jgi:hypothetical protein
MQIGLELIIYYYYTIVILIYIIIYYLYKIYFIVGIKNLTITYFIASSSSYIANNLVTLALN